MSINSPLFNIYSRILTSSVVNQARIVKNAGQEIKLKSEVSKKHCGKEGHWLEDKMGIKHNSKNEPDIFGYEMKKNSSKITFGDFSASEYLFSKKREILNKLRK